VNDARRAHLADLEAEARYHGERYDLARARAYGGRGATTPGRMRTLKEARDRAHARLVAARRRNDDGPPKRAAG
jgi:hypothetical protein